MKLAIIALAAALTGCASTVGPFVTNINSKGDGSLTVEKCTLVHDSWSGSVTTKDCRDSEIKVR